jgi:hypothetical protein
MLGQPNPFSFVDADKLVQLYRDFQRRRHSVGREGDAMNLWKMCRRGAFCRNTKATRVSLARLGKVAHFNTVGAVSDRD